MTISTIPTNQQEHDPTMTKYPELPTETKPPSTRTTRYVYHCHGHASLHAPNNVEEAPTKQAVPFEVVLRQKDPITSDEAMDTVRQDVRGHIVSELDRQGSPYIAGDVMIRGISHLHTILVEADDPDGPAVRVLS